MVSTGNPISISEINAIITSIGNECSARGVTQTSVPVGTVTCGCNNDCICEAACGVEQCLSYCSCQTQCQTVEVESDHFTAMRTDLVTINANHCYCEGFGGIETHSGCSGHSYSLTACATDFEVHDEVTSEEITDMNDDITNLIGECDCNTYLCNCQAYCNCETASTTYCSNCGCNNFCFCQSACDPESCKSYCQCQNQCSCDGACTCDGDCLCDDVCNCEYN